jgi:preprotein translocase subunit YajC
MGKKARQRMSASEVQANAKAAGGVSWQNELKLPEGIRIWEPDKAGKYKLNMLIYEVKTDQHPDRARKGGIWWKYPFRVHKNIGVSNRQIICPSSVGKPCPVCEERKRLVDKGYDENKKAIDVLNGQRHVAYNIEDPEDADKVVVYASSYGKFGGADAGLDKEIAQLPTGDPKITFYDVSDGFTLDARFGEEKFEGRSFFQVNRIDFIKRNDQDEDEVLSKVCCLDELIASGVMEYDALKAIFLQLDEDGNSPKGKSQSPSASASGAASGGAGTKSKPTGKESDDGIKVGDRVTFKNNDDEQIVGEVTSIDSDGDCIVEDDKGEDHDAEIGDLELAEKPDKKTKAKAEPKEEPEPKTDSGNDEPSFAVGDMVATKDGKIFGKIKSIDLKTDDVVIKDDEGEKHTVDIDDIAPSEAENEQEPEPAGDDDGKAKFKVGDHVEDDSGAQGVIMEIDTEDDDVTIKRDDNGMSMIVDLSDIKLIKGKEAKAAKTAKGKADAPLKEGDKVEWNGGKSEGEILKIKDDKAKCMDDNGDKTWVSIMDLKRA